MNTESTKRGRPLRGTAVMAVALAAGLALTACSSATQAANGSSQSGSSSASSDKKLVIGLAMKTQLQKRWEMDVNAMQGECAKQNVECVVQYANDDATKQASQVENLLSQGIDVLVLVPVNGDAGKALVAKAHAQNVKVVDYDEFIPGSDFFVTRDNAAVGKAQAEGALAFSPDGNWAVVKGDPGNPVAQEINGAYETALKGAKANIVYNQFTKNWDPAVAQQAAEGVLSANNDNVKVFLTSNDGMATGVIQALKGRNLAGKVYVSGLDADVANLKLIQAGEQTMSVWTKLDMWGQSAIQAAVQLAKGETPTPDTTQNGVPTKLIPIEVVTKDNMCQWLATVPAGWATVQDVYGTPTC